MGEKVPESERLDLKIEATVSFSFGTICDAIGAMRNDIDPLAEEISREVHIGTFAGKSQDELCGIVRDRLSDYLSPRILAAQRETRNQGNAAIRIIQHHLRYVKITRKHHLDKPNPERIAQAHERGSSDGH